MKTHIISFILLFNTFNISSQAIQYKAYLGFVNGLHSYGLATDFPADLVADDFGPRSYAGVPYNFHGGVDYNAPGNDEGDIILAVNTGDVHWAGMNRPGLKWIVVTSVINQVTHNLCFEHVSENGDISIGQGRLTAGCRVKMMDAPNTDNWAIIFHSAGVYSAIGPVNGTVTFFDENNLSRTIGVSNNVVLGGNVAPLGGSGFINGNPYDPHAHTQGMINITQGVIPIRPDNDNNAKNPLQYITHPTPTYLFENSQLNVLNGAISPVYPGSNITPLRSRILLNGEGPADSRYGSIMDIEKVEFKLRNHLEQTWNSIKGISYDKIQLGGRLGNQRTPSHMDNTSGGWNSTGMAPRAYFYNNYDDFYFTDFYARIHKNDPMDGGQGLFANYPWDSRYLDGNYEFKCAITRAQDQFPQVWSNAGVNFKIDNFKPFIRQVSVNFDQIGVTAYWNQWTPTAVESQLKLGTRQEGGIPAGPFDPFPSVGPLTVYVIASEEMSELSARIPSLNTVLKPGVSVDPSINKWKIEFGIVTGLNWDQCHKIVFTGKDINNNDLLDFQIGNPPTPDICNGYINNKVVIPKRIGAASWLPATTASGLDEVHRFRIQRCTTCHQLKGDIPPISENNPQNNIDCVQLSESISLDIHYASSSNSADGSINLSIDNNFEGCITWYDINHNEIMEGPQITNLLPGWYCYQVKQECCSISNCVEIGTCALVVNSTLHHPSAPGESDGSIVSSSNGGNEPLIYLWNTGATSAAITNLGIGTYTVTVSDEFHCSAVATANLINCPTLVVDLNAIAADPTACDAIDGGIHLNTGAIVNGGTSPYAFHWEDGVGNVISIGENHLYNLSPGTYCFVATDALGCTGSKCYDLIPDHYPTLVETIFPACTNQSNGSINVTALSDIGEDLYTFSWDDGIEDYEDIYSQRDNLFTGTYCVTVTSQVGSCSVTRCYVVPSSSPNGALSEIHTIVNPCPNSMNGQINLTVTGGVEPYTFNWFDILELDEPRNRNGLAAGTYTVSITDYCGTVLVKEFNLVPVSIIKVLAHPGCSSGQAEVTIRQGSGNPPYSVSWGDGSNNYLSGNLASGEHCVSVFDALGCMTSECVTLDNKRFHIETVNSCLGMADGVISLDIFNPDEEAVFVYLNGAEVYSNLAATPAFTVDIPSLSGIADFNVDVTIGNCIYPTEEVRITNDQIERLYDHYDDPENECWYKDACKGNIIPNSYTVQPPFFDLANGIAGIFRCAVPIYCGGQFIEDMDFDKYTVRAAEYEAILLQAANIFPSEYIKKLLEEWDNKNVNPCRTVRYCSATMEIMSIGRTFAPNQQVTSNGNGCFALDCSPAIPGDDDNFCVTDPQLNPPIFLVSAPDISQSCNPAKANLYQLIVWEDELKAEYPGSPMFEGSQLHDLIDEYRIDPKAKCSDVIFCQRDFSVIWTTNIDLVQCDDYAQTPYLYQGDCMQGDQNITGCQYWICAEPNDNNIVVPEFQYLSYFALGGNTGYVFNTINIHGHGVTICPDFPGHFFTAPGNDEYIKISNGCTDGTLINFANAISEGVRFPKGITKCGNTFDFMDYSFKSLSDRLWELPETEYLIDDWDSSQIVLIKKVENEKSYSIDCHGDIGWSRLLTSNVRLKISYFEKEGNEYIIGGEFLGNLNFGTTQISTQYNSTGFIIRVSPYGTLLSHNIIRNLNPNKPLIFVRGEDGVHIVGRSTNQPLSVDGTVYQIQNGYLADIRVGENGGSVTSNLLAFDSSLTIVRSQRSLDNSRITYVLRGNGSVHYGGEQVIGNSAQDLIVVTCNNSGSILWVEKINGQNIVGQDFDIAYGAGNNLMIGLTYNNAISVQGNISTSNGNSDILIVQFNNTGQLIGTLNYGTAYGENISKMFFADSILYFGGEFNGDTTSRKIGAHTFLIDSSVVSMPYMSFITESSFTQEARGASNDLRSDSGNAKSNSISVYPNPFSNNLTLRIETSKAEKVSFKVFDGLGRLVIEQTQQSNLGSNEYVILTSQYPNGVYLIKVVTESGTTWSQKVVKN